MKLASDINKFNDEDIEKKLVDNFDEAMCDTNFKKFITRLKLNKNILKKYTSFLQESSIEYNNCSKCKSILECKNKVVGYAYLPVLKDDELIFKCRACKYKKKLDEENKYLSNINVFGSSLYLKDARMKDIYIDDKNRFETITWLKNFITQYLSLKHAKGLYLCGSFGCGKTYLVTAMINELAKNGVKCSIVFWSDFLRDLKASFQSDYSEKYEIIKHSPILLIDDIGAEVVTSWGRDEILCPLLQYRMEHKLATFFTSNLNIEQFKQHISSSKDGVDMVKAERIVQRILQLTDQIEIVSKNLRN